MSSDGISWWVTASSMIDFSRFLTLDPPHDKTNNVAVRPAKTQISLGICPVWSASSLSAWRKLGSLATHWAQQRRLWSDWADAQADLSLRWAHTHFVGFVMKRLIFYLSMFLLGLLSLSAFVNETCITENSKSHISFLSAVVIIISYASFEELQSFKWSRVLLLSLRNNFLSAFCLVTKVVKVA